MDFEKPTINQPEIKKEEESEDLVLLKQVRKEKAWSAPYTEEQMMEIDREVNKRKMLKEGAGLVFQENGSVGVEPTAEQIKKIKQEWEDYVSKMEARYANASDEFIKQEIEDLENFDRKRPGAFAEIHELSNKLESRNSEQMLRAALKEILEKRKNNS
ncbi:hypothetical protein KKC17_04365 [Patescibacteria group bacterium]|nr:hypothetical protein [Patescibacteria group bacterium]